MHPVNKRLHLTIFLTPGYTSCVSSLAEKRKTDKDKKKQRREADTFYL
jgi:hypothetical protein